MLSIDIDIWQDCIRLFPSQVSGKVNDFLHRLVAYKNQNLDKLTISDLQHELNSIDEQAADIGLKRLGIRDRLEILKKEQVEREKNMIEEEKKEQAELVTCDVCKIPKPNERIHYFPGGKVCNGCYLSEPAASLKPYMQKKAGDETKPGEKQ